MYEVVFLIILGLLWTATASIQDLKKREVPNWLSFSLIIFAIGFRFFYSLFVDTDFNFFYQGLLGLGIFFIVGNTLYYGRMFAGGDAKLMIAMGTILPFSKEFVSNLSTFALFIIIFLFAGAFYGLLWSFSLSIKNYQKFKKEFSKRLGNNKQIIYSSTSFAVLLILTALFLNMFIILYLAAAILIFPLLYLYAKTVDESCMVKKTPPAILVEGDWLYKDIKVGRITIKATWDGLSKKDIQLLKKNKKHVLIREGIPFVPVFLISFIILIILNQWIKL